MKTRSTFGGSKTGVMTIASCVAAILSIAAIAAEKPGAVIQRDGLVADLQVGEDEALVRWRFLRPLKSPLKEITGDLDGQSLGTPEVRAYPAADERTSLLVMLDISGKERQASITKQMADALLLTIRKPPHVQIATAVYAGQLRLIVPRSVDELVATLAVTAPEDGQPNLAENLKAGIAAVSSITSQRRALVVFTDGYSNPPMKNDLANRSTGDNGNCNECASGISELAFRNGTSIYFITTQSDRPGNLDVLDALAQRTGGRVVREADLSVFMTNPLAIVDSGGSAMFPVPKLVRYFWQSDSALHITFSAGDDKFEMSAPVLFPKATLYQTATYLWRNYWIPVIAALLIVAIVAVTSVYVLLRRRRHVHDLKRFPALAVLQDTDSGTVYPVQASPARIGRLPENEVVISDKSVSRLHAVLERVEDGSFLFLNKSESGNSFVNGQAVENCKLSDGDVIALGATRLRFARVPSW